MQVVYPVMGLILPITGGGIGDEMSPMMLKTNFFVSLKEKMIQY